MPPTDCEPRSTARVHTAGNLLHELSDSILPASYLRMSKKMYDYILHRIFNPTLHARTQTYEFTTRRVRSDDATRLRCRQICSDSSKLSPSCEFNTHRRRNSNRQLSCVVGSLYWLSELFILQVICTSIMRNSLRFRTLMTENNANRLC